MKEIKVVDINGDEVEGRWNENTYNSKHEGCVRIYLSNKEVHITPDQLPSEQKKELEDEMIMKEIVSLFNKLSADNKCTLTFKLLNFYKMKEELLKQEMKKKYINECVHEIEDIIQKYHNKGYGTFENDINKNRNFK